MEDRIDRVAGEAFGFAALRPGQREAIEDDDEAVVVLFDDVGYKTLALEVVRERRLLEQA